MDNNQIREGIISDLLNVLKNQSAYYLTQSQSNDLSLSDRKEIEKELNDINSTLKDVTSVSAVYTIQQLEDLKSLYQQKYNLILEQSQNLEINTLNIQFDSLTPQQKEFLKGQKGDKGDKGDNGTSFTYDMFTPEQLQSLKGQKGDNGISFTYGMFTPEQLQSLKGQKGDKGDKGDTGTAFTYDMFTPEQLQSLKGQKGDKGDTGTAFTYDMFTPVQLESLKGQKGDKGDNGTSFTYDMFTPEQLESLKGEKGADGLISFESLTPEQLESLRGQKGDKGDNGTSFTYDMFTPEQLQALKGEKGDKGDNGTSFTYNDMTQEQKQQIADLVTITGGGNSSLKSFTFLYENQPKTYNNNHIKTTFKPNSSFTVEFHYYIDSNMNFRQSKKNFFFFNASLNQTSVVLSESSTFITSYISNDGYLCFYVSGATSFSILDVLVQSAKENPTLNNVQFDVVNSSNSTTYYYTTITNANYLLLKQGIL